MTWLFLIFWWWSLSTVLVPGNGSSVLAVVDAASAASSSAAAAAPFTQASASAPAVLPFRAPAVTPARGQKTLAKTKTTATTTTTTMRKLQNNKNDKNDVTPSTMPTMSPIPSMSPVPSSVPSMTPTTTPVPTLTVAPTTFFPTTTPSVGEIIMTETQTPSLRITFPPPTSMAPTNRPVIGVLKVSFSLLAKDVTQESILVGNNEALVQQIQDAMKMVFCQDTDFLLVEYTTPTTTTTTSTGTTTTNETYDCPTTATRQRHYNRRTQQTLDVTTTTTTLQPSMIRPDQVLITVQDKSVYDDNNNDDDDDETESPSQQQQQQDVHNYTLWTMEYPVIQIGTKYLDMASNENVGTTGLSNMQNVAQLAIDLRITDGSFDTMLNAGALIQNNNDNNDGMLYQVAIVGEEIQTWSSDIMGEEGDYFLPLDPAPWHALRIAGILMFVFSLCMTCTILRLAKRRRIEKEWDADFKVRGKGGLVTEEGVDYMLQIGRTQSAAMVMSTSTSLLSSPGAAAEKGGRMLSSSRMPLSSTTDVSSTAALVEDGSLTLPLPGHMNLDPPCATQTAAVDAMLRNT